MEKNDSILSHTVTDDERKRIRVAVGAIAAKHLWVGAAYLYGSATSSLRPARDIDIGILTTGVPVAFSALPALSAALASETGLCEIPFDIRVIDRAAPVFLNNVLAARACLFSRNDNARIDFEARAMVAWLDFKPAWTRVRAEVIARWSRG